MSLAQHHPPSLCTTPPLSYCFIFQPPPPLRSRIFHLWQALSIFNSAGSIGRVISLAVSLSVWPYHESLLFFNTCEGFGFVWLASHSRDLTLGPQSYTSKKVVTLSKVELRLRWFSELFLTSLFERRLLLSSKGPSAPWQFLSSPLP